MPYKPAPYHAVCLIDPQLTGEASRLIDRFERKGIGVYAEESWTKFMNTHTGVLPRTQGLLISLDSKVAIEIKEALEGSKFDVPCAFVTRNPKKINGNKNVFGYDVDPEEVMDYFKRVREISKRIKR